MHRLDTYNGTVEWYETTIEVYRAIRKYYKDVLEICASYTDCAGSFPSSNGIPCQGTIWGIRGASRPIAASLAEGEWWKKGKTKWRYFVVGAESVQLGKSQRRK